MSIKSDKKLQRKVEKIKTTLNKREGLATTLNPTKFIVIANYGLTTGATREELYSIFSNYGNLKNVIMVSGKQFSFIEFTNVAEAKSAFDKIQGLELYSENGTKMSLLLSFVNEESGNLIATQALLKIKKKVSVPQSNNNEDAVNELPPGLTLLKDFITDEEEKRFLAILKWDCIADKSVLKHRKVKHFGYAFRYESSTIDKENPLDEPIPVACLPLLEKLKQIGVITFKIDQLTVNRYEPGQGIPPHIDTHSSFNDGIVSLSLGSCIVMNFSGPQGKVIPVFLPRRSVLIMTGPSRYSWTHGIVPRKTDVIRLPDGGLTLQTRQIRTSFTFRSVRKESICSCNYVEFCDSHQTGQKSDTNLNDIEKLYVKETYEAIADHFNETRHKPWPRVVEFLRTLPPYSTLLDVGCGNGKYFKANTQLLHFGCDQSSKLLEICYKNGYQVFAADIVHLPLRSESVDACICIAVIHHLATPERRLAAIRNLIDLVRPGGKILIYVWAMEQDLNTKKSSYIKQQRDQTVQKQKLCETPNSHTNLELPFPVHVNRTYFTEPDILVPWSLKQSTENSDGSKKERKKERNGADGSCNVFHRYYHVFQDQELENLCLQIPFVKIVQSYYDNGNWCVILEKTQRDYCYPTRV